MPQYTNANGVWKPIQTEYANVNGVWKEAYSKYINVNGIWKEEQPKIRLHSIYGSTSNFSAEYLKDRRAVKVYYGAYHSVSGFGFEVDPNMQFTTPFVLRIEDAHNTNYVNTKLCFNFNYGNNSSGDLIEFTTQDIAMPIGNEQSPISLNITEAGGYGSRSHTFRKFSITVMSNKSDSRGSFILKHLIMNGITYEFRY